MLKHALEKHMPVWYNKLQYTLLPNNTNRNGNGSSTIQHNVQLQPKLYSKDTLRVLHNALLMVTGQYHD